MIFTTRKELIETVINECNRAAQKNHDDDFASVIATVLNQR